MMVLQIGSSGPDVTKLQQIIKKSGFDPGNVDSQFGRKTERRCSCFRKARALFPMASNRGLPCRS